MQDIATAAALSTESFPNSLLISTSTSLSVGRVEQLEKLDIQTLRLGEEAPRRVCYSSDMRAYGLAFLQEKLDRNTGEIARSSSFKVLGQDSFDGMVFQLGSLSYKKS